MYQVDLAHFKTADAIMSVNLLLRLSIGQMTVVGCWPALLMALRPRWMAQVSSSQLTLYLRFTRVVISLLAIMLSFTVIMQSHNRVMLYCIVCAELCYCVCVCLILCIFINKNEWANMLVIQNEIMWLFYRIYFKFQLWLDLNFRFEINLPVHNSLGAGAGELIIKFCNYPPDNRHILVPLFCFHSTAIG